MQYIPILYLAIFSAQPIQTDTCQSWYISSSSHICNWENVNVSQEHTKSHFADGQWPTPSTVQVATGTWTHRLPAVSLARAQPEWLGRDCDHHWQQIQDWIWVCVQVCTGSSATVSDSVRRLRRAWMAAAGPRPRPAAGFRRRLQGLVWKSTKGNAGSFPMSCSRRTPFICFHFRFVHTA